LKAVRQELKGAMPSFIRFNLKNSLKALLGFCVILFLVLRLEPGKLAAQIGEPNIKYLALAVLIQLAAKAIWTMRWQEVLLACGLKRRFSELLGWIFIGLFFNSFLPSAVGGDVIRGYYAARERGDLPKSYLALLIERALGLLSMTVLAASASLLVLLGGQVELSPHIVVIYAGAGTLCGTGAMYLFWRRQVHAFVMKVPFWGRLAANPFLKGASEAFGQFHFSTSRKLRVLFNSMGLQVVAVLFYVACARAVGLDAPMIQFFLIVPAATLAAMLPITLNGIGVREGVLVGLLAAQGAPMFLSSGCALLALLISTLFSMAGGVVYLLYQPPKVMHEVPFDAS
jgi:hypothetical protein